jgi:hypothetical protein
MRDILVNIPPAAWYISTYVVAVLALMVWTFVVASCTAYTIHREAKRWWATHLDEAARNEVNDRDARITALEDELASEQSENASLRAWRNRVKRAIV